jgi:hypothetical protein
MVDAGAGGGDSAPAWFPYQANQIRVLTKSLPSSSGWVAWSLERRVFVPL